MISSASTFMQPVEVLLCRESFEYKSRMGHYLVVGESSPEDSLVGLELRISDNELSHRHHLRRSDTRALRDGAKAQIRPTPASPNWQGTTPHSVVRHENITKLGLPADQPYVPARATAVCDLVLARG